MSVKGRREQMPVTDKHFPRRGKGNISEGNRHLAEQVRKELECLKTDNSGTRWEPS